MFIIGSYGAKESAAAFLCRRFFIQKSFVLNESVAKSLLKWIVLIKYDMFFLLFVFFVQLFFVIWKKTQYLGWNRFYCIKWQSDKWVFFTLPLTRTQSILEGFDSCRTDLSRLWHVRIEVFWKYNNVPGNVTTLSGLIFASLPKNKICSKYHKIFLPWNLIHAKYL